MTEDSVVLVCGDDEFLIGEEARAIVAKHVPEADRELGLEIIDGRCDTADTAAACLQNTIASAQTAGFFGGGKLTWLRDASFFGSSRAASTAAVKETIPLLTALIKAGLPDGQRLLISGTGISRAGALFKACQKHGRVIDVGGAEKGYQKLKSMRGLLPRLLEREGLRMSEPVREAFINRVGADTRMVVQELAKLRTYLGKPGDATEADVTAICSVGREAEPWDLLDAFSERRLTPTIGLLEQLLGQGKNGVFLATVLETRVRELLTLAACMEAGWLSFQGSGRNARADWHIPAEHESVLRDAGADPRAMNPWMLQRRILQARNFTVRELRNARVLIMTLREQLVSTSLDERVLLEAFIARVLRRKK